MKQRLGVAAALLSDPKVMVLDEPTNGLDPQGIAEIRDIIIKVADQGKTVILASHILDEVQKVCTHFAVLNYGELMYNGSVDAVSKDKQEVEVGSEDMDRLGMAVNDYSGKINSTKEMSFFVLTLKKNKPVADLSEYLVKKGIIVTHLVVRKKSLEQQFLDILNESK